MSFINHKILPIDLAQRTLQYAETLEGSVRHTGLHACGIIIGKDRLVNHIPICKSKDTDLWVTQFDGKHVEDVGMLKMDFLGLKTLSIIKDAVANVKESRGIEIDIDHIPMDDGFVQTASFGIAGTQCHMEGATNFLVKENLAGKLVDLKVGTDGELTQIACAFVDVELDLGVVGAGVRVAVRLALVRHYVTEHRGHIDVGDRPGGGAVFALSIPAA